MNSNGFVGYITPNTWLNNQSNTKLRSYILKNAQVLKIVDYSKVRVFDQATVLPIITILQKTKLREEQTEIFEPIGDELILKNYVSQEIWEDGNLNIFNIDLNESDVNLREKIEKDCVELGEIALVKRGIQLYETGKGIPKQKAEDAKNNIYESNVKVDDNYIKFWKGKIFSVFRISGKIGGLNMEKTLRLEETRYYLKAKGLPSEG